MNARARLTPEEFLNWEVAQGEKHELVSGRVRLRAGATRAHQIICLNAAVALRRLLRGQPCQPFNEQKILTPRGNWRYADISVDCGAGAMTDLAAAEPRVVIEVESPSTSFLAEMERVEDYQSVPSIQHIVVLAQDRAYGRAWTRGAQGWSSVEVSGLDAQLALPAIACELALAELYEGVRFPA